MAIVATVTLKDDHGRLTTKRIETTETLIANAKTAMGLWAAAMVLISDMGVVRISYTDTDDGEAYAQTAGANLDVGGTFRLELEDGAFAPHKIPGVKDSLVTAGSDAIDIDNVSVIAYFDLFKTGGSLRLSDGEAMEALISGTLDR